jgi:dethiobiotin synthetase
MKQGFFITGTDTGVGKTLISAALIHGFAQRGLAVAGMKPVAAGCSLESGALLSDDVAMLRAAANVALPMAIINSYAFEPPLAPHIAAQQAGEKIELAKIDAAFTQARAVTDVLIVEGVGGFSVPVNETQTMADVAVMLGLPVVLVVGMRLGCLNHALLSVEAIRTKGLKLAGWVANCIDPEMRSLAENIDTLRAMIAAPCIGIVHYQPVSEPVVLAKMLDCDRLLNS